MKKGAGLAFFTAFAIAAMTAPAFPHGGHGMEEAPPPAPKKEAAPAPQRLKASAAAPFINLPESFARTVRGCTADGHVVRVMYNMALNLDDLAALEKNQIKIDPQARLGATGANAHITAITALSLETDATLQTQIGALLDSASLQETAGPSFPEKLALIARQIAEEARTRHGAALAIELSPPQKTGDSCPALR